MCRAFNITDNRINTLADRASFGTPTNKTIFHFAMKLLAVKDAVFAQFNLKYLWLAGTVDWVPSPTQGPRPHLS